MNPYVGDPSKEWPAVLDVAALLESRWQGRPFRQFLLKVHSRCNLACDYCYVYMMADQSWRSRPMVMAPDLVKIAGRRISEHARAHSLPAVRVILHGGEPLLAGREYLSGIVESIRGEAGPGLRVEAAVQTNGVLLDEETLHALDRLGVRVGVSLDGGPRANDRNRRYADGRGSYEAVARALRLLNRPSFRHLYGGLLCTVDLANDPVETYEALAAFDPPVIDFLLPHGTWRSPPPGRGPDPARTPYADWLIPIFDRWYSSPGEMTVRFFQEIVHLLLGGASESESIGLTPTTHVVVETDGTIEQTDSLKAVGQGAPGTGMNIREHSFDAVLRHPGIVARQLGWDALGDECKKCRFGRVCGAGLYTHRYRPGTGFRSPSVYCADLYRLIGHIRSRLISDLRGPDG
ncbi:radical SAM protein [Sphaerisporangium melleum]|uniref:Radical SAM protein n=1 Tax=Sphaerisporangium melleum TaxID=321316 RepID=A0A917VVC7_9ACTN|nr:FxsB family cyclophane-forming radical SAM/SPASM peptide maturase [Sphaerisporangium melleum]GGL18068.1 radical SAM protein [Sphaerisporangium melleum]GII73082.1 radical SAM protein [Sphaerisporangium melleum]